MICVILIGSQLGKGLKPMLKRPLVSVIIYLWCVIMLSNKPACLKYYASSFTSQAKQTQWRHKKHIAGIPKITTFFTKLPNSPAANQTTAHWQTRQPILKCQSVLHQETSLDHLNSPSTIPHAWSSTVLSDPVQSDHEMSSSADEHEDSDKSEAMERREANDHDIAEDWEEELMSVVEDPCSQIKDWSILHMQIKADLKKNGKNIPLTCINQLNIILNFATLCLKGYSRTSASVEIAKQWHEWDGIYFSRPVWALALHYQIFEISLQRDEVERLTHIPTWTMRQFKHTPVHGSLLKRSKDWFSDTQETPVCYQWLHSSQSQYLPKQAS